MRVKMGVGWGRWREGGTLSSRGVELLYKECVSSRNVSDWEDPDQSGLCSIWQTHVVDPTGSLDMVPHSIRVLAAAQ